MSKRPAARPKRRAAQSPRADCHAARPAGGTVRTHGGEEQADAALHLPEECTLAAVHDLKSKLAALLKAESPVCVYVSDVRRIDTASLQLLAAFARDRRANRLALDVRGESAAFEEGIRLLGLARLFDLPPAAHPPERRAG